MDEEGEVKWLMNEEEAIRCLRDAKEILDEAGVRYWLDQGTLLGAVRDKQIIPWDDDIDFSVMADERTKILEQIPRFVEKGFHVVATDFNIAINRNEIPLNIRLIRIKGDTAWNLVWRWK